MKKLFLIAIGLATACNSSQKTVSEPQVETAKTVNVGPKTYADTVTEAELKEHLYTYASDEFEGRETGQEGQKKAVDYIKAHYQKIGIPAAKGDGDYFQKVPLELKNLPTGTITINGEEHPIGDHIMSFWEAEAKVDELVYVGYGIEEGDYSDYDGMDVNGKWVLMKGGEPQKADGTFVLSGSDEASKWSNISEGPELREDLANAKGVKGMIYLDEKNFPRYKRYYNYMKNNDSGQMSYKSDEDDAAMLVVDAEIGTQLYPDILTEDAPKIITVAFEVNLETENTPVDTENVVAVLKGTEKPEEYIVISSHLDHIGITADGQINNGADDDGSGTVALLEIADAFKKAADAGNGPKRSIVFLHVTGEEKGLLGSQYYTDNDPIFPLEKTVANLNIDMIGRIDPKREGDRNYIYLIGSDKLSTDLHELSEAVNEKYTQIELDYTYNDENDPNRFYYRSDHYNFAKNNIPIIFYFNGTHDDYHKPGDTPDKINYDLLANRTKLVFYTAWETANREARVVVDKAAK
ncbi:M28 family peptidase [Aggregatimonas sangjinii]|uniref:M28 family peptidase n=1 Tax=Aggregatimonas sangjinii TaxID=2583587 RepID=A0A5B7SNN8_9FLAO|nr:M28 family peptidase [Aggregatimonas sangjinii]QCW99751.1 M28 family peptidase [Aggregatimonas sangjinii]